MRKLLIGAAALLASLTGVLAGASPAQARGWHGGWYGSGWRGGYGRGGYWGGGWGGYGPAVVAGVTGLAVGAAITQPYFAGPRYFYGPPPAYYVGPSYFGYLGGCRRQWVWTGWGYRLVNACF